MYSCSRRERRVTTGFFPDHPDNPESTASGSATTSASASTVTVAITQGPSSPPPASHTGAIAGGVIGGVLGLVVLGALVIYLRKRRPQDVQTFDHPEARGGAVPDKAVGSSATPIFEPLMHDHDLDSSVRNKAHISQASTGTKQYVRPSLSMKPCSLLTLSHFVPFTLESIRSLHVPRLDFTIQSQQL